MSTLGVPFSCLLLQGAAQEGAQSNQNGGPTQATSGPCVASVPPHGYWGSCREGLRGGGILQSPGLLRREAWCLARGLSWAGGGKSPG